MFNLHDTWLLKTNLFLLEWQQYASEIGTPNGPTRYVDQSGKHEHLKGKFKKK